MNVALGISLRRYGPHILLAALTLAVFWKVATFDYVHYDDGKYVADNAAMKDGINSHTMQWAFTTFYESNYHPLTWVSLMLDARVAALPPLAQHAYGRLDPRVFHVTNLLLHLACVLLLFSLLERATGSRWRSAFVAALFAIHPMHVESVAWIAERKDVLSTVFWLLTMWTYVSWVRKPRVRRYAVLMACFVAGLLSKPMLVSLPIVLILVDIWPLRRIDFSKDTLWKRLPSLIREKTPMLILSGLSCAVTFYAQREGGAVGTLQTYPFHIRISNAIVSTMSYLVKMVWPVNLSVCYRYFDVFPAWQIIVSGFVIVGITVFAVRSMGKRPYIAAGWFWYLITLVPVIGLVQVGYQSMADRYTYVPYIGIFVIVAWGVPDLLHVGVGSDARSRRMAAVLTLTAVFSTTLLAARCYNQVGLWRNGVVLFEHAASLDQNDSVVYCSLGVAMERTGDSDGAIVQYKRALQLDPRYSTAHGNLGGILMLKGDYAQAQTELSTALRLEPNNYVYHNTLGKVLILQGRVDEALDHFRTALLLRPGNIEARVNIMNTHSPEVQALVKELAAKKKRPAQ